MKNMAKTFQFERFDVDASGTGEVLPSGDGEWIRADAAIDREAVNAAKIRTLEVQLSERGESRVLAESDKQEAVGEIAQDDVLGWHFKPYKNWLDIGYGAKLYAAPLAPSAEQDRIDAERMQALEADKARLDSGCIMTTDYDDFGDRTVTERRGLNLRAAIDAAIAKGASK
jgi:hypothetical protein